ncbi:MAG: alpha-L-fucosidase [Planctomycetota bacterium]
MPPSPHDSLTTTIPTPGDHSWFVHDRFGLFVHWGLYSMPARHEWVQSYERIAPEAYSTRYFDRFDPDLYRPELWAAAAGDAGMKYAVITAKHHEGFCLWDSGQTDFKATQAPCGRDLLRPFLDAIRERGIRAGLYYSLIDWHHPDYVVDFHNHPQRESVPPTPGAVYHRGTPVTGRDYDGRDINDGRDQSKYAAYMREQVRELLTDYGDIDVLWFDFTFQVHPDQPRDDFRFNKGREAWDAKRLYEMIRELRPEIMLTDRLDLDLPLSGGDFKTPEQAQPREWVHVEADGQQRPVVWEACQTFSGSWGYHRDENEWRSSRQLISTLIDCVSKGGNLLLNVGPTGRGEIDERALSRLGDIGRWMKRHDRSIYGCTQAPPEFRPPEHTRLTYHPQRRRLYVHLFDWPYHLLHLDGPGYVELVEYAQLLHDASEVGFGLDAWHKKQLGEAAETLTLNLPTREPAGVEVPVVELFLK